MSENSLFALLLRKHWWVSVAVAIAIALLARFVVPQAYAGYAFSFSIPFLIIAGIAAWRHRHTPSSGRVEATVEAVAAMNWRDFYALMEQAYRNEGYTVTRENGAADFKLIKSGRVYLVSCKRWKAATHGVEPLSELEALRAGQEVHEAVYVALGELGDKAMRFATTKKITVAHGPEIARLLRTVKLRPVPKASK